MSPCTNPAATGPAGRRPGGSSSRIRGSVQANSRASATRGRNTTQRRSPWSAAAIASAACAAAIAKGTPPSASRASPSSSRACASATAATTSR